MTEYREFSGSTRRMPMQDLPCPLCHAMEETIEHLFMDCPCSTIVWSVIKYPVRLHGFPQNSLLQWTKIAMGIDCGIHIPRDIAHTFALQAAITFDVLWQTRIPS